MQLVFDEDMARAFARALNDWIAAEWLDRDPRLRASIVVPLQNVEFAVDEIERCAGDPRFVQVLVLAMGETALGRRRGRVHQTPWPQSGADQSGVTWVPPFLWRLAKLWRGLRTEIPWVDRSPRDVFATISA